MRKRSQEHRENNKDKLSEKDRARHKVREVFSDPALKWRLWERQNGMCLCCAKDILRADVGRSPVDHVTPLARGGSNEESNLALAHTECNKEKHNKTLEEHWLWRVRARLDGIAITHGRLEDALGEAGRRRFRESGSDGM